MATFTWTGEDGGPEFINAFGVMFYKGEPTEVDDDHPKIAKFVNNAHFVAGDGDEDGLSGFTVVELKAHAEAENIDLGDATRKADIVAAIRAAKA